MTGIKEKLKNVLKLLDDESIEIQRIVQSQLYANALEIIIHRNEYRSGLEKEHQTHFDHLLSEMHLEITGQAFKNLIDIASEDVDLEQAMLVISYWNEPTVDCASMRQELDGISKSISENLPKTGHPLAFIDHMSNYLLRTLAISGNRDDYYNPDNSFLHKLLKTKKGIPITIGILYMLVGNRLGLPVYGVPMPGHFILKFYNEEDEVFFDPFYEGKVYSRQMCYRYLQNVNVENREKVLNGCSNHDIVTRVLRNLHLAYSSYQQDDEKIKQIETFLEMFERHYVGQI